MRVLIFSAAVLAVCSRPTLALAGVLIDDFSEGPITVTRTGGAYSETQTGLDANRVIGGSRLFEFEQFGAEVQTATVGGGTLQLTSTPAPGGSTLVYFALMWGSDTKPLGIDLKADGGNRLHADIVAGYPPRLYLGSPGGLESRGDFDANGDIFFADLLGSADLSNVSWISLATGRSLGYEIGALQVVPEPATLVLAAAAGAAIALWRRRDRR